MPTPDVTSAPSPASTVVVVPTFQERENIEPFLRAVRAAAPDVDVLIVDDNSPDGTADLAEKLADDVGRVEVLRRAVKDGLGNAYRAGFAVALDRGYDQIIQMDADLSHDPGSIADLRARLDQGADVAIGSRYVPGGATPHWPLRRRLLSRWGNRYTTLLLGLPVRDATSGFRAYKATTLREIRFDTTRANGYAFQMEVAARLVDHHCQVEEVPITFTDRVRGTSKMSAAIMVESLALATRWGIRNRLGRLRHR
ncbi:MAG TPA: polyprenol monophosphomannose synthase [Acidimicrobiales bacterium]|jgi:dolichol-phosphate mannosyltransferase|nr:polyprenol monophosphomannose synthase [Acidimicrobiales bacterium]